MTHYSLVQGLKKRTDPFFTLSINLAKEITVEFQLEADTLLGNLIVTLEEITANVYCGDILVELGGNLHHCSWWKQPCLWIVLLGFPPYPLCLPAQDSSGKSPTPIKLLQNADINPKTEMPENHTQE